MSQIGSGPHKPKVARVRIPQYPTVDLGEAIERVKRLHEKVGRAGVKRDRAVYEIGFNTPHGEAMSVLATLKKFGLIEPMGDNLSPSARAMDIINRAPDDPRRRQALKDAALSPQIFRELYEPYRVTGLPADSVLQGYLLQRGFNPKAIGDVVRNFKNTLALSNISTEEQLNSIAATARHELEDNNDLPSKDLLSTGKIRRYPMEISIPRNVKAELLIVGGDFRKDDVERLKKQFDRIIDNLSEAFQD